MPEPSLRDEALTPEEIAIWWRRYELDHASARLQRQASYAAQKTQSERLWGNRLKRLTWGGLPKVST